MKNDPDFQPIDPAASARFSEIATFFRTRRRSPDSRLDVALVGVPFDLAVVHRPGARQGPAGIREASRIIRRVHPTLGTEPFSLCNVADVGDAPVHALDIGKSFELLEEFFAELEALNIAPVAAGGDHSVTLPILRGIARDRSVAIVQFDAHSDTSDSSFGLPISHATTFRRAIEEGLIDGRKSIQIGIRGSRFSKHDLDFAQSAGMRVITMDEYEEIGREAVVAEIRARTADIPVYVSFDIDGLDPAYASGTGVPEVGGLSVRDAQVMIRSLHDRQVVGADICEVAPVYDPTGQTCVSAANLMFELLCVVAEARTRRGKS